MSNTPAPEALLHRIVDGEASEADWTSFRAAADIEPSLWQDLAESQRLHAELAAQVQGAARIADEIELPIGEYMTEGLTRRIRAVGAWGGWAAAAAVALAWGAGLTGGIGGSHAGLVGTPDQALQAYLDQGQRSGLVVGELPTKLMVETRPATTGDGYEVIYLRQIMERTVVPELYRMGIDDSGRPQPIRLDLTPASTRPM